MESTKQMENIIKDYAKEVQSLLKDVDQLNGKEQLFISCFMEHTARKFSNIILKQHNMSNEDWVEADDKAFAMMESITEGMTKK